MLGNQNQCRYCGKHCTDNPPPGKERREGRRHWKRSERGEWQRKVSRQEWKDWEPWPIEGRGEGPDCESFETSY